jgi:hypothetical protein
VVKTHHFISGAGKAMTWASNLRGCPTIAFASSSGFTKAGLRLLAAIHNYIKEHNKLLLVTMYFGY